MRKDTVMMLLGLGVVGFGLYKVVEAQQATTVLTGSTTQVVPQGQLTITTPGSKGVTQGANNNVLVKVQNYVAQAQLARSAYDALRSIFKGS